jgi:ABC-2 type transport system ATP-binding protein
VDDELTVLLSSHNVGELERVCDHLVLIAGGLVQIAGDIDTLLEEHRVLTGPHARVPEGPEVVCVDRSDRHAHVVARIRTAEPMPGWESQSLTLEELVLAYLRRSSPAGAPVSEAKLVTR